MAALTVASANLAHVEVGTRVEDIAQRKAAEESLAPGAIKRAVKNWRADTYRV